MYYRSRPNRGLSQAGERRDLNDAGCLAGPKRGPSMPGAANERQEQDEQAFDRQKEPKDHTTH
jgi:hypothetical protein